MRVHATTDAPADTAADTVAVGVFEGKEVAHDLPGGELQALLAAGEARRSFKHLALGRGAGKRWIVVGLGERDAFDAERARVAAAVVAQRAAELGTGELCWEVPHKVGDDVVAGLVDGTLLAAYRYEAWKSAPADEPRLEALVLSAHHDVAGQVETARVVAEAVNAARDLANGPPNDTTPARLAERARALAAECGLEVEVLGRAQIRDAGMGAFSAVAQGSAQEPQLITLRHRGAGGSALGLVGKAVTFDAGGLSIKPAASMPAMKFDMAGGAAVLEAIGAVARLELPAHVVAVIGATENVIGPCAMRPGDVVTSRSGTTIEINNTDAEGRLVLADCLTHAVELGAERLVDVATLTGAIVGALGKTYAGLFAGDDAWGAAVAEAAERAGEPVWRMPLHADHAEAIKGRYADIVNSPEERVAGASTAAAFLRRFTGDVPWAHLDIAGVGWDRGRPYAAKGATGWGVRALVELARSVTP